MWFWTLFWKGSDGVGGGVGGMEKRVDIRWGECRNN